MDNNHFYNKFLKKSDSELKHIIDSSELYSEEAVLAASEILRTKQVELSNEQKAIPDKIKTNQEKRKAIAERRKKEAETSILAKRTLAFLIDLLLLSGISYTLGFLLIATPVIKDPWEPILSLIIILGYFAILNSNIGGGTFGKRLLNLKVINYNLQPLGFLDSLKRYCLLIVPFFGFTLLKQLSLPSFGIINGLEYSYFIAIFYFLFTDKPLRRSFHDLLSKSLVIGNSPKDTIPRYHTRKTKAYFIISGGMLLILICFNTITIKDQSDYNTQLQQLKASLKNNQPTLETLIPNIQNVDGVSEIEGITLNNTNGITSLEISVRPSTFHSNDDLNDNIYSASRDIALKIRDLDNVKIIKHYGFKMTLASYSRTETKTFEL